MDKNTDINQVFTGICKEPNHLSELKYYCKSHNILCCVKCIAKIKDKENGHHGDCNVCLLEDFENETNNKLNERIKILEDLKISLEKSMNEIKESFNKISDNREQLKIKIQTIFTKLRNALNDKEDELLQKIDDIHSYLASLDEKIKNSENLPKKSKNLLKKIKENNHNLKNNQISYLENDLINMENNIKEIREFNALNEKIQKNESSFLKVVLTDEKNGVNNLLERFQNFGNIEYQTPKLFNSNIKFDENLVKSWLDNRFFSGVIV